MTESHELDGLISMRGQCLIILWFDQVFLSFRCICVSAVRWWPVRLSGPQWTPSHVWWLLLAAVWSELVLLYRLLLFRRLDQLPHGVAVTQLQGQISARFCRL